MFRKLPGLLLCALISCLFPSLPASGQGIAGTEFAAVNGDKFDAPLEFLLAQISRQGAGQPEAEIRRAIAPFQRRFHIEPSPEEPLIHLLMQIQGDSDEEIRAAGIPILGKLGDVVVTALPASRVAELQALRSVVKVEVAKALEHEVDLSMVATRANLLRTVQPDGTFSGQTGFGALIGIVDSGIDIYHRTFAILTVPLG
jgi:hypothetical protein